MKKQPMLVLSLVIFILIISGGYFYYRYEKKIILKEQYSNLRTIADLKIDQITNWREERLADAQVIAESPFIRQNFSRWLLSQDSTLGKDLLERFALLKYNYKYEDVIIVSDGGKLLLGLNTNRKHIDSETIDYCKKALQDKKAFLSDFYFSPAHDTIHFDVFAPILNDRNVAVAVLVLRVNPYDYLYPLIQSWFTSSKSAETLIIRRDGDSILYENELRHISNSALRLQIPLTSIKVPAVQAVLGHVGIYEGIDYRGIRVLSDMRPVPGTPWFMIAKVDQSEIFSELRYRTVIVIIITLLLLLFFGIGISWLYNIRQKNIYRKLLETGTALQESEVKYRSLFENAQVGMYRSKIDGSAMLDVNKKFGEILGLTREESLGKAGRILWADTEDRNKMMKLLKGQGGILYNYEARLLAKNGEVRNVLASIKLNPEEGSLDGTFVDITERKRAEKAQQESERIISEQFEKLNEAQHIAMIGSWEWNLQTNHVWWSDETYRIFGVTPQNFVPSFEANGKFIHPDDVANYGKSFEHSIQTGEPLDIELRLVTNDGLLKHCNGKGKIIYDDSGQPIRFVGTMMDITGRKLAEGTLRNSEAFLNNIIDQSPVPMWISDDKGILIRINKACCSILKITEQDVIGKYNIIEDNIVREQGLLSDVRRVFDNGETVRFEIRYNTSKLEGFSLESEAEVILDTTIFPIKDYNGRVTNAVIQHMDITGRKLAEKTLQESEARYKTLVENIPQKIFMKSSDYRWISVNENFARDLGISPEEIVGKVDYDFFSRKLADKYRADDVRIFKTGKTEELEEKYVVAGKETWVNTIKTPVRNKNGEIMGVLGIFWDITDRKLAEEEIRKLNAELEDRVVMRTAQLEASNKELEAFSYSVSHDLRAPLRHVSGYVELLNKHFQSDLSEKGQHYLYSISDSVRQMGVLIDDLLQFSRTGRIEMNQSDVSMNEIVKEVTESLCKDNPDRKIEWVQGKLSSVYGDEAMLHLVWMNLLGNAVKFTRTRKNARIEIGVHKEKKELVFYVRDNGVGFNMQYAHKLFGVFQRLHSTEEFEGTGIGLANVHRIVLRHGGRTWAEAEPDKGAVFYFSIPKK